MKIPLTAFILQDMDEFVHAHATYRFVILDEEDEKPRILVRTVTVQFDIAELANYVVALDVQA